MDPDISFLSGSYDSIAKKRGQERIQQAFWNARDLRNKIQTGELKQETTARFYEDFRCYFLTEIPIVEWNVIDLHMRDLLGMEPLPFEFEGTEEYRRLEEYRNMVDHRERDREAGDREMKDVTPPTKLLP